MVEGWREWVVIALGHDIEIESGHRPRLLLYIYVRTGPEIASVPCSL